MESLTYFKNMRITPRKYREVVRIVRGMPPVKAMQVLSTTNKKAAVSLSKVLKSAITNAITTLKVSDDMLQFKLLTIEEGNKLRRYRAGSRGMAKAFLRRMSHIKIIIEPVQVAKTTQEPEKVKEPKKEVKAEGKQKTKKEPAAKKTKVTKSENK